MGKASSNKKVARAAKAGGSRARAAGERNVLFPSMLALVVVLGTLLVVYARDERVAEALQQPLAFDDHWHSAYGIYVCDAFEADLPEYTAPQNGGNHTHGDGLMHIHPFSSARAGENATLLSWLRDAGDALGTDADLTDTELVVPLGDTLTEGDDSCEGVEGDPIVQVHVWDTAARAIAEEDPDRIITEDFGAIRFDRDGQAFTIAFAPEGADIPPPATTSRLADVGSDLGVDPGDVPDPDAVEDAPVEDAPAQDETTEGETSDTTEP